MIKYDDKCSCVDGCCNANIEEDIIENDETCECCQDKIDTIESFLAEYTHYVKRGVLDVDMFIVMLEELYDDAYQNGKVDSLEIVAANALAMAWDGMDDLS